MPTVVLDEYMGHHVVFKERPPRCEQIPAALAELAERQDLITLVFFAPWQHAARQPDVAVSRQS